MSGASRLVYVSGIHLYVLHILDWPTFLNGGLKTSKKNLSAKTHIGSFLAAYWWLHLFSPLRL